VGDDFGEAAAKQNMVETLAMRCHAVLCGAVRCCARLCRTVLGRYVIVYMSYT